MTLEEVRELFPEVPKEAPQGAFGYIYITFEPISGKFYIGKQARKAWKESYYGGGCYPKQWKKSGLYLIHWPIKWCDSQESLDVAEYIWVDNFKDYTDIANLVEGGNKHKPISDEVSNKKREYYKTHDVYLKDKRQSDDVREKLSKANLEYQKTHINQFYGHKHSEKTKELMREVAKSRYTNPAVREKNSKALKEYFKTHNNPFKGKNHTEATKNILSEKAKERMKDPKNRYKVAKKVICLETGEIFNSITEAARAFGSNRCGHISSVCKGIRNKAFGKTWAYYTENENTEKTQEPIIIKLTKILCIETGEIFNTLTEINEKFGVRHNHVSEVCRGKANSSLGYH